MKKWLSDWWPGFALAAIGAVVLGVTHFRPAATAPPSGTYAGRVLGSHRQYDRTTLITDRGTYQIVGEVPDITGPVYVAGGNLWTKDRGYSTWVLRHIVRYDP
jgi:hypothetical protein